MNAKPIHQAPFKQHQVLFRAPIISTNPDESSHYPQDVIDINRNGKADALKFKSAGYRRSEVQEPTIHSGTDACGSPVGMNALREVAAQTGQRFFDSKELGNWSVYRETITFGEDGGSGSSLHDWQNLKELSQAVCPEYKYRELGYAIDVKRNEFVVYDPNKVKS